MGIFSFERWSVYLRVGLASLAVFGLAIFAANSAFGEMTDAEKPWYELKDGIYVPATYFGDVPNDVFYAEAMAYSVYDYWEDKIGSNFYPGEARTRGGLAKMILRAKHEPLLDDFEATFVDVPADHPQAAYIYTGLARDYWHGYADGSNKFGVDDQLMRVHLAVIISNILDLSWEQDAAKNYFPADTYPDWGIQAIQTMRGVGAMNGKGSDGIEWGALDVLNKAESLTAVFRIFEPESQFADHIGLTTVNDDTSDDSDDDTSDDSSDDSDDDDSNNDEEDPVVVPEPAPAPTSFSHASSSWVTSTLVDSGSAGRFGSLAVDSNDDLHLAHYQNSGGEKLMYMTNKSGRWVEEMIAATSISVYSSIAVDDDGGVHVAYYETPNYDLKYARKTSGGFSVETVDSNGVIGQYNAIALDSSGNVYISYIDVDNGDLKMATNKSGSFTTEVIDANSIPYDTAIAVDSNGKIHISYTANTGALKYASKTASGSSWTTETVNSQGWLFYSDLAIDSSGVPHIAYHYAAGGSGNDGALMYTSRTSGSWSTPVLVDDHLKAGEHCDLAFDNENKAFIAYHIRAIGADYIGAQLRVATNYSGSWQTETLEESDNSDDAKTGEYNSLVMDSTGRGHLIYYHEDGSDLKYAVEQ